MLLTQRTREQIKRLKTMGWTFIGLASLLSGSAYLLPTDETHFWLSSSNKEGIYVLSLFFAFLGFYCLGALWRRRNFIGTR